MTKHESRQKKQRIIFRADGNSRIGLGHVTRSLALAAMLEDEYECVFAIQSPDAALKEQILESCHGIIALPTCEPTEDRFLHEIDAYVSDEEIVVIDGYHFKAAYQQNMKSRGAVLVCIDDIHAHHFVADAIINPAGGVHPDSYSLAPYSKLYLGPEYALLRRPFLDAAKRNRLEINRNTAKVLLCLGGADPENHTLRVAEEIQKLKLGLELEIVVGSAYKHTVSLNKWLSENNQHRLHQNLPADALCALMRSCPVAVTSASGVAYEYAAVGGALFILQTATNQSALYRYLLESEMAKDYNSFATAFRTGQLEALIKTSIENQIKIFDGQSDERLKSIFKNLTLQSKLSIRAANSEDLQILFNWANDPIVRSHSFNSAPIPLEIHTNWFNAKLRNSDSLLYIAEIANEPAAHIRFEVSEGNATISYLIGEAYRGKGLGHTVLLKGVQQLLRDREDVMFIDGLVQRSNIPSLKAFEKAGFKETEAEPLYPHAVRFKMKVR